MRSYDKKEFVISIIDITMKNIPRAPFVNEFLNSQFNRTIPASCYPPETGSGNFNVPFSGDNGTLYKVTTITLLIAIYTSCILYIYYKKNAYTSTKARSPYTTIICFLLICLDGVSNTIIFS